MQATPEMMPSLNIMKMSNKVPGWLALLIIIAIFFNAFAFAWENAIPLIKSDGWRFINIYLTPWYEGTLEWRTLWTDHHPQPVTASLFIINSAIFDLRMDFEALFAILFAIPTLILFSRHIYTIERSDDRIGAGNLLIVLIGAILFSLNSTAIYTWSLVTLGYLYIFFASYALLRLDTLTRDNLDYRYFAITACYIAALLIFLGTLGKVFIYASLGVLIMVYVLRRDRKPLISIASIIIGIAFSYILTFAFGLQNRYNETSAISKLLENSEHLFDYLFYIGVGLSSAWTNLTVTSRFLNIDETGIIVTGCIVLSIYMATLFIYVKNRIYEITLIPCILIFISLLSALGGAMFRFDPTTQSPLVANVPRYYLVYALGLIGIIWILFIYFDFKKRSRLTTSIATTMIYIFIANQYAGAHAAWKSAPYIQNSIAKTSTIMVRNSDGDLSSHPPRFIVSHNYPEPYLTGISFLKEHQLNLFSKNYDLQDGYHSP